MLLILTGVLSLSLSIAIGYTDSGLCLIADYLPGLLLFAIPSLCILFASVYALSKRPPLKYSVILFIAVLILGFFMGASSNARCVPSDSRKTVSMRLTQDYLNEYYASHQAYPESIELRGKILPDVNPDSIQYTSTGAKYQLCTTLHYRHLYMVPLNSGEGYCIGPKGN
jgi:hypothetical protein